jgi:hypothetical protein
MVTVVCILKVFPDPLLIYERPSTVVFVQFSENTRRSEILSRKREHLLLYCLLKGSAYCNTHALYCDMCTHC